MKFIKTLTSDPLTLAEPVDSPRSRFLEETKEEIEEPPNLEWFLHARMSKEEVNFPRVPGRRAVATVRL